MTLMQNSFTIGLIAVASSVLGGSLSMTPKQSLTRKQSLIRHSLAVLGALLLTAGGAVGISIPASAAPAKALEIVSVTNTQESGLGLLVQGQEFAVEVRVVTNSGRTTTVSEETRITVTASEPTLEGKGENGTNATIPANGSGATFSRLTFSPFDNDVVLTVSVQSGVELLADEISVDFALTAVGREAEPNMVVTDQEGCAVPTPEVPICGQLLLPNGANELDGRSDVVLSIGSCDGLGRCRTSSGVTALVATGAVNVAGLYNNTAPATLVIACDKALCGGTGVPKLDVIYSLDNDGALNQTAPGCARKGVIGPNQKVCVDYVSSTRSDGDLYLHLLFKDDIRGSM
jgi:hypothetical protein